MAKESKARMGSGSGGLRWLSGLQEVYGTKLLVTIFCTHHLLKGFVGGGGMHGLVGSAMEFVYRGFGVTGPNLQVFTSVALLPWSMKALMGLMSDGCPIRGYHKAPYMLAFGLLAALAYLWVGITVGGAGDLESHGSLGMVTAGFFAIYCHMALCDLLVEAKYSEKVKAVPARGPDLITFVWAGISVGGLVATGLAGLIIGQFGPAVCILLALPFASSTLWPAACNYLEEVPHGDGLQAGEAKCSGHGKVPFILALVMGSAGLALAFISVMASAMQTKLFAAVFAGALDLLLFSLFLRPEIAKINAFFFIQSVFHIGTHGASFYFFTDKPSQYPGGPHFSPAFFVTVIGSVASVFSLCGMLCYNLFAKRWKYRSIVISSSIAFMVVNCLSAIVFVRLNLRLHIDDKLFVIASSAMQSVIGQLSWMPMTVMLAQLVPHGLESTMYALLAGSLNLGQSVSNYVGAFILQVLGVNPSGAEGEGEQFENLWVAALISAVAPCVPLLLVRCLIPDSRQTDRLLREGEDPGSATTGSLFEQGCMWWQGEYDELSEESSSSQKNGDSTSDSVELPVVMLGKVEEPYNFHETAAGREMVSRT